MTLVGDSDSVPAGGVFSFYLIAHVGLSFRFLMSRGFGRWLGKGGNFETVWVLIWGGMWADSVACGGKSDVG